MISLAELACELNVRLCTIDELERYKLIPVKSVKDKFKSFNELDANKVRLFFKLRKLGVGRKYIFDIIKQLDDKKITSSTNFYIGVTY